MKRFYKSADVESEGRGFSVRLDDRAIKTPMRNAVILPTEALADAIAAEWNDQGDEIDPATMPLTALAEGALDQITSDRQRIVDRITAFADSDMLYYRGDDSQGALADHQAEHWDPLLEWARSRYDISFNLVRGIMHQAQPGETVARLTEAVKAQDDFALAPMLSLVGLTGSLVITLALVEGAYDADTLWPLANLEELWQEHQWGADDLASKKRDAKEMEYRAAVRFVELTQK